MQMFFMVLCGIVGGVGFIWLKIPGGAMVGAMAGTILYLMFLGPGARVPEFPPLFQSVVYIAMGILIGSVFRPELFELFWSKWPVIVISTLILLTGGFIGAILLYKSGLLTPTGAYLASSPGGLNAVAGIANQMGSEAPLVVLCQTVRLYTVLITAPFIGKLLHSFLK